jgi:hypothetical protein
MNAEHFAALLRYAVFYCHLCCGVAHTPFCLFVRLPRLHLPRCSPLKEARQQLQPLEARHLELAICRCLLLSPTSFAWTFPLNDFYVSPFPSAGCSFCVARVELMPAHELRNLVVPETPRAVLHCVIMRVFAAVSIASGESPARRTCIETVPSCQWHATTRPTILP